MFSLAVLIGRGLDHHFLVSLILLTCLNLFHLYSVLSVHVESRPNGRLEHVAEAVPDAGAHQRRQKDAPERRVHRGGNRAVLRLFGRLLLLQPLQALHRHDAEGVYSEQSEFVPK